MKKMTPKAIRINLGLSAEELAKEIQKITNEPFNARKIQDRESGRTKWTATEILALAKIAKIDDIELIDIN